MKKKLFVLGYLLLLSIFSFSQKQPHSIFIITDQHRADAFGCVGNDVVVSPNIDHLAERGDEFVKDCKLVVRENKMLYSPNFPTDERTENERVKQWHEIFKGID
jgi:hypothetical protein